MCPVCRGPAEVVPGCVYSEADVPLFDQLSRCLQNIDLADVEAWELALLMDHLRVSNNDRQTFRLLLEHLPAMDSALPKYLEDDPKRLRRTLSMLSILLNDRAYERQSGAFQLPRALSRRAV